MAENRFHFPRLLLPDWAAVVLLSSDTSNPSYRKTILARHGVLMGTISRHHPLQCPNLAIADGHRLRLPWINIADPHLHVIFINGDPP